MPEKRKNWNDLISGFRASDLVFLDESGCNTDMTRRYADSFGGSRAVDSTPLSKPKNTTILSSIQLDGTLHDTTFSGGTTVEHFKHYLKDILLPHLNGKDILKKKGGMIMNQAYNVSSALKTTTFQMRMNPEIKQRAEQLYASYGLNLTDAINIFIQQSLNMEGLPFLLSPENEGYMQSKALKRLMAELDTGWKSAERDGWVSEEEAMRRLETDA